MWNRIYHHKWFPRVFYKKYDGGVESGVTGYMLIEWKPLLSIGILHFAKGSREAYHSHAFNAVTWWLVGLVTEERYLSYSHRRPQRYYKPSLNAKFTSRKNIHKVIAHRSTWALTIRGPWQNTWCEIRNNVKTVLTHGRKEVSALSIDSVKPSV
jgi:hypothetical protein